MSTKGNQNVDAYQQVLPSLDNTRRDRLLLVQYWWTSAWTVARLLDIQKGAWQPVIKPFPTTFDDLEKGRTLVRRDPDRSRHVLITETFINPKDDWDYHTESRQLVVK